MRERIRQMLIKEFIQILRDPRMKSVIFLMPIIQVLVFGYAVTTDVKHVATAVYDLDSSVSNPRGERTLGTGASRPNQPQNVPAAGRRNLPHS